MHSFSDVRGHRDDFILGRFGVGADGLNRAVQRLQLFGLIDQPGFQIERLRSTVLQGSFEQLLRISLNLLQDIFQLRDFLFLIGQMLFDSRQLPGSIPAWRYGPAPPEYRRATPGTAQNCR